MDDCYCANCGRKPEGRTCCWYTERDEEEPHPHPLVPGKPWEAWSADHRFLIALLMERFGGAAEEWELLCRLPWPQWRLVGCVCERWLPPPKPRRALQQIGRMTIRRRSGPRGETEMKGGDH